MPKLKDHTSHTESRDLTPDEREAINSRRPPSERLPEEDEYCPARVRNGDRAGEGCSKPRGHGTSHPGYGYCAKHGGNTPAGRKNAARQYGRELIRDWKFGGDKDMPEVRNITAEEALLEELRRSIAMVRFLEERIGAWEMNASDDLADAGGLGLPRLVEETSKGAPGVTDVQAWLLLYREERKHLALVSKMCIDAKISARLVNLAETQGKVIKNIVKGVLEQLGLTDEQAGSVPTILAAVVQRAQVEWHRSAVSRDAWEMVKTPEYRELTNGQG
jgi:hypothetical protein